MLSKILKYVAGIVLGLVILAVIGVLFFNTSIGRSWLSHHLSLYAGQVVEIKGDISFSVLPFEVHIDDLSVSETDRDPWLRAGSVMLTSPINLWSLSSEDTIALSLSDSDFYTEGIPHRAATDSGTISTLIPMFSLALSSSNMRIFGRSTSEALLSISNAEFAFDPKTGVRMRGVALLKGKPLQIEGTLEPTGKVVNETGAKITGQLHYSGLDIAADGTLANLMGLSGLDVHLTAGGDIQSNVSGEHPYFIGESVEGRLSGDVGALIFDIEQLEGNTRHGVARLSARVRQEADRWLLERANFSAYADDAQMFMSDFGIDSRLFGTLKAEVSFHGDSKSVLVERFYLDLGEELARFEGTGQIRHENNAYTVEDGHITATLRDVGAFLEGLELEPRLVGQFVGRANFQGDVRRLSIDSLQVGIGGDALDISGAGQLLFDEKRPKLELALAAQAQDLRRVAPNVPFKESFGHTGNAEATLRYADSEFSLVGLTGNFSGPSGQATLTGDITTLNNLTTPSVKVELKAQKTGESGASENALRHLDLDLKLPGGLDGAGSLKLSAVSELGDFEFEGQVSQPRALRGINGQFRFQPVQDEAIVKTRMRPVLVGDIQVEDIATRNFELIAKMEGAEGSFAYRGAVDEAFDGEGRLEINEMDPNIIAALFGVHTELSGQLNLNALTRHTAERFELNDIDLKTGTSNLQGKLQVLYPGPEHPATRVHIDAVSQNLDLVELGLDVRSDDASHYFSRAPLNLNFIGETELDIKLKVDLLHSRALDYENMALSGTSRLGIFELVSTQQLLGGGTSKADVVVDARGALPDVKLAIQLSAIDPAELRAFKGSEGAYSGNIDVEFDIQGLGDSVQEILSNADGHLLLRVNDAKIPNKALSLLSADFLFEMVRIVNPFMQQSKTMEIECGLAAFVIRNGIAQAKKSIVIKGQRLFISGEGVINLGTEEVGLVLKPKAQGGIGLNTSGLVKFIGIGGTLSKPNYKTDAKGLLMSGASLGAAVASGGMSLFLQNMFDRVTTGNKECVQAEAVFRDELTKTAQTSRPKPALGFRKKR